MKKQAKRGSALLFVLFFLTGITLFFARLITSAAYATSMATMRLRHHQNEALVQGAHRCSRMCAVTYFDRICIDGHMSFTHVWKIEKQAYTSVTWITPQSKYILLVQTKVYKGTYYCCGFSSRVEKQDHGFKHYDWQRL